MKRVLIIGATSVIAQATARIWAERGYTLYLVARQHEKLQSLVQDLNVRGKGPFYSEALDLDIFFTHEDMIARADKTLQGIDIAFIAHGVLPDQKACQTSALKALNSINTNALSVISLLTPLANLFEERKSGCIAVISSAAGDRGRQRNYVYGCAKAMVTTFLAGLRQRLSKSGVRVITIKPGFVDTPMTKDFKKGPLWAAPEKVSADVVVAIENRNGEVYTPWFWRPIMLAIRCIPAVIFNRIEL